MTFDIKQLQTIVREAGKILKDARAADGGVEQKQGEANFVTEFDVKIQQFLVEKLSAMIPDASFFGEEETEGNQAGRLSEGFTFIIDPIDGTTNFIRGSASYSVCIALMNGDKQVCGVVHVPALDTTYFAEAGKGAFAVRGGVTGQIHVSGYGLDGAIIAMGTSPYREKLVTKSFDLTKKLLTKAADIRRSGSAALDICYVAEGVYDLMFELSLYAWDFTAASIILTEAGGVFSDLNGESVTCKLNTPYVAGSPAAHADFIEFIKAHGE